MHLLPLAVCIVNTLSSPQAVVRVSKQYLPHMSALLESPKVRVFIGDGFKFLADNTSTYDVIITDSSDPVGPAAALFEKPYFQLLHDALTPGGNISTQAECLWLHLQLVGELRRTTLEIFETAEYAFTTIPTYPSGQIGFLVCSSAPNRDLKTALRTIPNTRYYNSSVHKAAFVLPEFGRALIEEQKNITPPVGRAARALAEPNRPPKKVLLLGSGFVARPAAEYIARDSSNDLTIGAFHKGCIANPSLRCSSLPHSQKCRGTGRWSSGHEGQVSRRH